MNQRGKKKNELKEIRTISETFRTILNAPTFNSQESQKKTTKRKTMRKYLRRKKSLHTYTEASVVEDFPKMGKRIITQFQDTKRVPNRTNPRKNTPRHISN